MLILTLEMYDEVLCGFLDCLVRFAIVIIIVHMYLIVLCFGKCTFQPVQDILALVAETGHKLCKWQIGNTTHFVTTGMCCKAFQGLIKSAVMYAPHCVYDNLYKASYTLPVKKLTS